MDCSLPGSSVHGILQARILEWDAMLFSRASSWPRGQTHVSCISGGSFTLSHLGNPNIYHACYVHTWLLQSCLILCDPMDCSHQAPLSMGFSRQEYWSGLLCHPPKDLPDPGIKPGSPQCRQILYHLSHQGSFYREVKTGSTLEIDFDHIGQI